MRIQVEGDITIDAAAEKVWHIVAHEFDRIGEWATAIPQSRPNTAVPAPEGAEVGGRVCATAIRGFPDIQETFTYYEEDEMRYGYLATAGLPRFVKHAENNWSVHKAGPNQCTVRIRGELEFNTLPGIFLVPFFKMQLKRVGDRTMEELKYFVEQGEPHPRKRRANGQ